ncbi:hypothetical protein RHMOL_Rhmol13G0086100 [Rhododendron molle]|uniref:Uncharacterized protein n=1 Tax=Rhododendron molle TaxID=49168 RepID=A0ACC0L4C2_RHOML|nr:hypothetical protein RHMOL_Rhmol13G0086100 [Rhododendron molle]
MSRNYFQGTIPFELGRLRNLTDFQIGANNLSGEVPPSIYNISSLLYLDVRENQFYGKIPQDIGFTLPNLLGLFVGANQFTGHLPVSLSNASGLQHCSFADNNFTGTMLTNLGSLKDLERLTVSINQLETDEAEEFSFLTSLTNCSKLRALDIGFNRFKGELPASIEYGMGSKASIQGDVYSFGIILLEIFTGRKPTDTTFVDVQNIHHFTKAALPERVREIAEPSLFSEVGGDDDDNTREGKINDCLVAVLTIGVSCSMEPPRERMDMRDVVAELCRIRTKTFGH